MAQFRQLIIWVFLAMCIPLQAIDYERKMVHIDMAKGLSNDMVYDITFDGDGMPWISTYAGVNRVIGEQIVQYRAGNSNIGNDQILHLNYNWKYKIMLMATSSGGIRVFNFHTHDFETFGREQGLRNLHIVQIHSNKSGDIWILCDNGDVYYMDYANKVIKQVHQVNVKGPRYLARCMFYWGNDQLLGGFQTYGMGVLNLKTHQSRLLIPQVSANCIFKDHYGNLWVGCDEGLFALDMKTGKSIKYTRGVGDAGLVSNRVLDICEVPDKSRLCITTDAGLNFVDLKQVKNPFKQEVKFGTIPVLDSFVTPNPVKTVFDKFNNLWIASRETGVYLISPNETPFHMIDDPRVAGNPCYSLLTDQDGTIYAGGNRAVAAIRNHKVDEIFDVADVLNGEYDRIIWLHKGKLGKILFCTERHGMIEFDPVVRKVLRVSPNLSTGEILCIRRDPLTNQALFCTDRGLFTSNSSQDVMHSVDYVNKVIRKVRITDVCRDAEGKLWVATRGYGLYVFDRKGNLVMHKMRKDGKFSSDIHQLYLDRDNYMWIGTSYFVFCCVDTRHPDRMVQYMRNKNYDENIMALQMDKRSYVWASTFSGIMCADRFGKNVAVYNQRNGMPFGLFQARATAMSKDGTIYFGSAQGLCYFNPEQTLKREKLSKLHIVYVNDIAPDKDSTYIFPAGYNDVNVKFMVENIAQSNNVDYQYIFDGQADEWLTTNGHSDITLNSLAPGSYHLKIRAKLKNQTWDDAQYVEAHIIVRHFWYWCWWSILLYILIILGTAGYIIMVRNRALRRKAELVYLQEKRAAEKKLDNERIRFYTGITHELFTPLTLINAPVDDLMDDASLSEKAKKRVKMIRKNVDRLLDLINQTRTYTNSEVYVAALRPGNIAEVADAVFTKFTTYYNQPGVKIVKDIDPDVQPVLMNKQYMTLVLQNFLTNAIHFTQKGMIRLAVQQNGTKVLVAVEDTGIGISEEALPHIFEKYYQGTSQEIVSGTGMGLYVSQKYIEQHHSRIQVKSKVGVGTTFFFELETVKDISNGA